MKQMLIEMIEKMNEEECSIFDNIIEMNIVNKENEIVEEFVNECGFDDEQLLRNVIKKLSK